MQRTTESCATEKQTAGASPVIWIVLNKLAAGDSLKNILKRDILGIHFLLSMLRDADSLTGYQ